LERYRKQKFKEEILKTGGRNGMGGCGSRNKMGMKRFKFEQN
jgi:hypothetical protein